MASVKIHDNVGQVKLLESIRHTLTVTGSRVLARLEFGIGNQVGQRVGLDYEGNSRVGVLFENRNDGWFGLGWFSCT